MFLKINKKNYAAISFLTHPMTETLCQYYFAGSGRLMGLVPGKTFDIDCRITREIVAIDGPFSFNAETLILSSKVGSFYLPRDQCEKSSRTPNLKGRTMDTQRLLANADMPLQGTLMTLKEIHAHTSFD